MESELLEPGEYLDETRSNAALMALNASEIDTQITTAKRYPRSLTQFKKSSTDMVQFSEEVAGECMYALVRGGKKIEGPSSRFAEIIAATWKNCRAGARVIGTDDQFVTAQGVFIDLENNVAITYEVKRRITDKHHKRFTEDMIGVTSNAACSIALRNAVLKGVPKALWKSIYDAAKQTAIGTIQTLSERRGNMLSHFMKMGVTEAQICAMLEVAGPDEITLDHLAVMKGVATALKDGDTTIEEQFDVTIQPKGAKVKKSAVSEKLKEEAAKEAAGNDAPPSDQDNSKLEWYADVEQLFQEVESESQLEELFSKQQTVATPEQKVHLNAFAMGAKQRLGVKEKKAGQKSLV